MVPKQLQLPNQQPFVPLALSGKSREKEKCEFGAGLEVFLKVCCRKDGGRETELITGEQRRQAG